MKTILSFFVILSTSLLLGQEYKPLLNENNVWDVLNYIGEDTHTNYKFRLSDETLIFNEKEYTKIEYLNSSFIEIYLHENIDEKKVYAYYPDLGNEYLLYDFNLNVGDSLPIEGYFNPSPGDFTIIESITYETIFGIENIKTYTGTGGYFKVYEGIGAVSGLFMLTGAIDDMFTLVDFSTVLNSSDVNLENKTIIYPNPFTHQIQIESEKPIQHLKLFDASGKLILSKKSISELNSNLNKLQKGMYILQILYSNQQKENIKLIKK